LIGTNTSSAESSPGSLVIGGYDQNARDDPTVSVPLAANNTRSLVVQLADLLLANTLNGTFSATFGLPTLQLALDSGVSQLWLPKLVCDTLAEALGLTFDPSTELYLLNTTAHDKLRDLAPEFTFTLSANSTSSETVNIVLPYAAFDLEIGQPFYNTSKYYFPIRRAADEKLYVLGRAFLQEAYLVVDWERGNFSLSQARHHTTERNIVPIQSVNDGTAKRSGSKPGVIAGIVVAISAVVMIAAGACYVLLRRKRSLAAHVADDIASPYPDDKKDGQATELTGVGALLAEANSTPLHELPPETSHQQLMSTPIYELPGEIVERELDASARAEKPGSEADEPR
jgi:hypothetical protein